MASPCGIELNISLNNTLGALFIGNLAVSILFGVTSFQMVVYFNNSPKDKSITKSLVLVVWILDFLHMVMISHAVYYYTVTNYMNPIALLRITWSLVVHVFMTGTSDLIVRGLFGYRIWYLSGKNVPLIITIAIASLAVFVGAVVFAIRASQVATYIEFSQLSPLIYYSFSAAAIADIIISATLCVLLQQQHTTFKRTQSLIRTLTVYSINAGALTCVCAVGCLITYATMPDNFIFQAIYFVLPKLFLNSLLAMMNARKSMKDNNTADHYSIPLSKTTSSGHAEFTSHIDRGRSEPVIDIQIERSTDRKIDGDLVRDPGNNSVDLKMGDLINDTSPKIGIQRYGGPNQGRV